MAQFLGLDAKKGLLLYRISYIILVRELRKTNPQEQSMNYVAIKQTGSRRKLLSKASGTEYTYWEVKDEKGGLYANITDETVKEEDFTAEEFATVMAYALSNDLPTSSLGGMTPLQYKEAKALMDAAK